MWKVNRCQRGTATGATATVTGTGRAERPAAFPRTIVMAWRAPTSRGGQGSTAGQPRKGRKAGDIGPNGQKEREKKEQRGKEGEADGIVTATRRGAEGTEVESE